MSTGDRPLTVDEFTITPGPCRQRYVATLAIRYAPDEFVAACMVADDFLTARYNNVVVTGRSGSPNGDRLTIGFWASGKKAQPAA